MDVLYMFIIFLYLFAYIIEASTEPHFSKKKVNFEEAGRVCKYYFGETLARPDDIEAYQGNDGTVKDTKFWIPIKRNISESWWTINGLFYSSHLVETRKARVENQQCAVIHSEDDILDTVKCNRKQTGYICHLYKNASCPNDAECPMMPKSVDLLSVYHEDVTFYQAFRKCQQKGSSLYEFTPQQKSAITRHLKHNLVRHGHFLVGLTRQRWFYTDSGSSGQVKNLNWAQNEPSLQSDCCVIFHGKWFSAPCTDHHYFICVSRAINKPNPHIECNQSNASYSTEKPCVSTTSDSQEGLTWAQIKWILTVSIGVVFGFTGLACLFYCAKKGILQDLVKCQRTDRTSSESGRLVCREHACDSKETCELQNKGDDDCTKMLLVQSDVNQAVTQSDSEEQAPKRENIGKQEPQTTATVIKKGPQSQATLVLNK